MFSADILHIVSITYLQADARWRALDTAYFQRKRDFGKAKRLLLQREFEADNKELAFPHLSKARQIFKLTIEQIGFAGNLISRSSQYSNGYQQESDYKPIFKSYSAL